MLNLIFKFIFTLKTKVLITSKLFKPNYPAFLCLMGVIHSVYNIQCIFTRHCLTMSNGLLQFENYVYKINL